MKKTSSSGDPEMMDKKDWKGCREGRLRRVGLKETSFTF